MAARAPHTDDVDDHAVDTLSALAAAVAEGDRAAFAQLYDLTSARVFGVVLRVVVNRALAEEVLQEVYVYVWQNASRFIASKGSLQAWISTIAYRRAVDCVRATQASHDRDRHVGSRALVWDADVASDAVDHYLERAHLHAALAQLSPDQRLCVELAYTAGLTQSQIAARLGQPLGTVKSRTRTALKELRRTLQGHAGLGMGAVA